MALALPRAFLPSPSSSSALTPLLPLSSSPLSPPHPLPQEPQHQVVRAAGERGGSYRTVASPAAEGTPGRGKLNIPHSVWLRQDESGDVRPNRSRWHWSTSFSKPLSLILFFSFTFNPPFLDTNIRAVKGIWNDLLQLMILLDSLARE